MLVKLIKTIFSKDLFKKIVKSVVCGDMLAELAAERIKNGVNSTQESTQANIAKYATVTNEASAISQNISTMLLDGKIDDMEKEQIKKLLAPLFNKVLELV